VAATRSRCRPLEDATVRGDENGTDPWVRARVEARSPGDVDGTPHERGVVGIAAR